MFSRRHAAQLSLAVTATLASCAAPGGASPSTESSPAASASSAAGPRPIELGQLSAGSYEVDTDPALVFDIEEPWGAGAAVANGARLTKRQTSLWITSGWDEIYVENGATERIGTDTDAVLAQLRRNNRFTDGAPEQTELAGLPAVAFDYDVIYENNSEGGASIVAWGGEPLFVPDRSVCRMFLVDGGAGPLIVLVVGPESAGIDSALSAAEPILESLRAEAG